jgi:hypothetical protein
MGGGYLGGLSGGYVGGLSGGHMVAAFGRSHLSMVGGFSRTIRAASGWRFER